MSVLSNLEKGLMGLSDVSYKSIDKLMRRLAKDHEITPRELHDRFKAKHDMIPDDWIKKQMRINEEGLRDWFGKSKSKDGKPGWVQSDGSPCANEPGETGTPKCYSSSKKASMSKKELRSADTRKSRQDPGQQSKSGAAKPTYVSTDKPKKKMKEETFNEAEDKKTKGSGSKDACYNKVKSRYSVWPSAYASGALVKCRKVGAANWGNSTKKEEFEGFYDLPAFTESQIAAMKYAGIEVEVIDEACWKGYTKKGMKTMFGKRYPNCVKKEEVEVEEGVLDAALKTDKKVGELHKKVDNDVKRMKAGKKFKEEVTGGILVQDAGDFKPREIESVNIIEPEPIKGGQLQEIVRTKPQTGNMYQVVFGWRGKMMMVKLFFPDATIPNRQKVAEALNKMYPGSQLRSYSMSIVDYDDPYINVGEEVDFNTDVQNRMDSDERKKRNLVAKKGRMARYAQNKKIHEEESVEEGYKDLPKGKMGMKAGKKIISAIGHAGKAGAEDEGTIENQIRTQKADKKARQAQKIHDVSGKHNKTLSKLKSMKNNLVGMTKEETEIEEENVSLRMGKHKSRTGGLTKAGRDKYNRATGSNLQAPQPKGGARKRSFCARMGGVEGPMKKPNGEPTRKALALKKWKCRSK